LGGGFAARCDGHGVVAPREYKVELGAERQRRGRSPRKTKVEQGAERQRKGRAPREAKVVLGAETKDGASAA
jgi:hypothetical protein